MLHHLPKNRVKFVVIISLLLVVILLLFNSGVYFNCMVSLKYEVQHPESMFGSDISLENRGNEIKYILNFCRIVYIIGILLLILNAAVLFELRRTNEVK